MADESRMSAAYCVRGSFDERGSFDDWLRVAAFLWHASTPGQ